MPNNYFQFKQFTVQQDKCAMKVCTDACLFGAWAADLLQQKNISDILDIGAGTGLLSLLLAQKTAATITAVEIDKPAFEQAAENFIQSPWKDHLYIYNTDIVTYSPGKKYDVIISNPPFFEDDLKSPRQNKNAAKHDSTLTLDVLCSKVKQLLTEDGYFAVLLPFHRSGYFIAKAEQHELYCKEKVLVKQTQLHSCFRSMLLFSSTKQTVTKKEIVIKDNYGDYTTAFTDLLRDYYLYL